MWRDTAAWVIAVAVLAMVLFAGCGKSKKSEEIPPQAQMPGAYGPLIPSAMPGQMPGASGPQATPGQPTEAAEAEAIPSGPGYQERYKQGELTDEELREEHELQEVERELGYPVGPE